MVTVFLLIFLAAVAGIIKPYIKGAKRPYFAIAAVIAFVLFMGATESEVHTAFAETSNTNQNASDGASGGGTKNAGEASAGAAQTATAWEYSTHKDEMRGTASKFAQVNSTNTVDLEFPYGETHGQIWIRQRAEDGLSVAFEVENGQVLCNDFGNSHVSIKFDGGPVQKFHCSGTSDGSSNVAFIDDAHRVLAGLKKSKQAIVEAEFFEQGRKQFSFKTAGLDWK